MAVHPLSRLRKFVAEAASLIGEPAAPVGITGDLSVSLSLPAISALSMLELAMAARILESCKPCCVGSPAQPDLEGTMLELCGRVLAAIPEEIANLVPAPDFSNRPLLKEIWRRLHDPELSAHVEDPCSLGYAYQFFASPARKSAQSFIQTANKSLTPGTLSAFTQLYTPDWVVEFLLANTVLCQWKGVATLGQLPFLLPQSCLADNRLPASDINVIDPACGAGHFLVPAYRQLVRLHTAEGWDAREAASTVLRNGIAGVDTDPVGLWVTSLALIVQQLKFDRQAEPVRLRLAHVQRTEGIADGARLMGSLHRDWIAVPDHPLNDNYQAVVMNPPYIGRKLLGRALKLELKEQFPESHQDLCAAFISRGFEILKPGGRLGVITQSSLLTLPSYGRFRRCLAEQHNLIAVVEAGTGVFPLQSGEKVNSMLLTAQAPASAPADVGRREAVFIDLTHHENKADELINIVSRVEQEQEVAECYLFDPLMFSSHHRYAFNYRVPAIIHRIIASSERLESLADIRQGLATSDNDRFVRYWWDVDSEADGDRWVPYVKGAGSERWYAPARHVVDWQNNGSSIKEAVAQAYPYLNGKTAWVVKNEQFYFKGGLTFSFVNTRGLAVRQLPPGSIFDVAGSALFAKTGDLEWLLSYLNSSFIAACAHMLNPTVNFQVGDLKLLPAIELTKEEQTKLAAIARQCIQLKVQLSNWDETSPLSHCPDHVDYDDLEQWWFAEHEHIENTLHELKLLEQQVDTLVLSAVTKRCRPSARENEQLLSWAAAACQRRPAPTSLITDFVDLLVYLVHHWLQSVLANGGVLILPTDCRQLVKELGLPEGLLRHIERRHPDGFLSYLQSEFLQRHRQRFQGNPWWCIRGIGRDRAVVITSTGVLRRLGSNGEWTPRQAILADNQTADFQELDSCARELLSKLMVQVSKRQDWTGADLHSLLSRA